MLQREPSPRGLKLLQKMLPGWSGMERGPRGRTKPPSSPSRTIDPS